MVLQGPAWPLQEHLGKCGKRMFWVITAMYLMVEARGARFLGQCKAVLPSKDVSLVLHDLLPQTFMPMENIIYNFGP